MSREKTPNDDQIRPIPLSTATTKVSPACIATNRKKINGSGVMSECGGKTLSMREFFEAGGRDYEVYLSYADRRPLPDSPVLSSCAMLSSAKDNRNQLKVDQLPPQMPDVASKNSGNGAVSPNPPFLTVVHLTATFGSPTPSAPVYTQTHMGHRLHGAFCVTSQGTKNIGAPCGFVAADVIDRVIASRMGPPNRSRSSFVDPFGWKDEKRCFAITERHTTSVNQSLCTMTETILSTSPIASSSPSPVSSISTTSATLPSTTSCTSPMESSEVRPSNVVDLTNECLKRKLTTDEDAELAIDLTSKRMKSADDDHCGAVNQSSTWPKEAPPTDGQQGATIELDSKGLSSPSIDGVVPNVVYQSATIFSDVSLWSVDQVVRFVANVQGCREYAEIFRQEEIDGACLIRLSEGHLRNVIRMKLGPALRLRQAISSLCSLDAI